MHTGNMDTTPLSRLFEAVLLFATFVYTSVLIDAEWRSLFIAVGGSVAGAVMLGYFRRDNRKLEQLFKVIASAIGGLVLGTVLQKYLNIEAEEYRLGLFFVSSMLALVVLRSLLSLTENNVADMLRNIVQRLTGLQTKEEKTRRRVERIEQKINKDDSL